MSYTLNSKNFIIFIQFENHFVIYKFLKKTFFKTSNKNADELHPIRIFAESSIHQKVSIVAIDFIS